MNRRWRNGWSISARCLANYEKANKDLDMARARNKDVAIAENK